MDNIPMNDELYLSIFNGQLGIDIEGYAEPLISIAPNYMRENGTIFINTQKKYKEFNQDSNIILFQEWFGQDNGFIEIMFKTKAKYLKWIREFTKKYNMKKIDDFMYFL